MILGRSPNLILGAFTALLNVAVLGHIGGFNPTPELVAALNIAAGTLITLVANSASLQIQAGIAAKGRGK